MHFGVDVLKTSRCEGLGQADSGLPRSFLRSILAARLHGEHHPSARLQDSSHFSEGLHRVLPKLGGIDRVNPVEVVFRIRELGSRTQLQLHPFFIDRLRVPAGCHPYHHVRMIHAGHECGRAAGVGDIGTRSKPDLQHTVRRFQIKQREHPRAAVAVLHRHQLSRDPAHRSGGFSKLVTPAHG